jgi:DNA-binding NarL/FixJ family response regulator
LLQIYDWIKVVEMENFVEKNRNGKELIKLIIADDDTSVSSAIHLLLDQDQDCWQVLGEARNVNELYLVVEQQQPQLILLDWELPEESWMDVSSQNFCLKDRISYLRKLNPKVSIIVLSSKPEQRNAVIEAGADSFVCKGDPPEFLQHALYALCEEPSVQFDGLKIPKSKQHIFAPFNIIHSLPIQI